MSRMFNLRNVLELVVNGLNNGAFTRQKLVMNTHKHVFHVATRFGKKLDAKFF